MTKKYTLRISLDDIKPEIWREIEVPSDINLVTLGDVLVRAMGWYDGHLHQFIVFGENDNYYGGTTYASCRCNLALEKLEENENLDGRNYRIDDLLKKKGDTICFNYDFGDDWRHTVTLKKSSKYTPEDFHSIILLEGKRACPPDDCGGVGGYIELLEAIKHPKSQEGKEMLEWIGYNYDPEAFDYRRTARDVAYLNMEPYYPYKDI